MSVFMVRKRGNLPDAVDRRPERAGHAFGQILPNEKERLNCAHLFLFILENDKKK